MRARFPLTLLALALSAAPVARAGTAAEPSGWSFEGKDPWKGWKLAPAEPREVGRSEWERRELEFMVPASGKVVVELFMRGAGRLEFDGLELHRLRRRKPPVPERRSLANPGFEIAAEGKAAFPAGWKLSGGVARVAGPAYSGKFSLRADLARPGSAAARQTLSLKKGQRYRLVVRVRGEVTAGEAGVAVRPSGSPDARLALERVGGLTLAGGRGRCGRLSAERGAGRKASLEFAAKAGSNYTLELLVRGTIGEKGRVHLYLTALEKAGAETPLAARQLSGGALGHDWRPLRINFTLRGASRLRLSVRVDGPAVVELDDLRVVPPRVVPTPRRLAPGDAGDNFRPKGRRPLVTSGGKADAALVRQFTGLVGKRMSRPAAFWQFWRSGRAFDHRGRSFEQILERGVEPGSVFLLNASRKAEAKWLAGRAVTVPDRPGAYAISVSAKALIVAARSREGFLAAASTLGWLSADGAEPEMFSCRVEDWPAHPLRAAEINFDGRLAQSDRELIGGLGAYRLSHLVVTGGGFWHLPESRTRADARDLAGLAVSLGLDLVPFLDALGASPALAEKSPASVEMVWHRSESHYLRGTERSYLAARNAVPAAGAPVEVTSAGGKAYRAGRDYQLKTPVPRLGADPKKAPRSWMRRARDGKIPDGGHVLASYNALPPPGEVPGACPRSAEALEAFRKQLAHLAATVPAGGVGIGGRLPPRMRTDKRTAGTRFKNGRLVADRVRELCAALSLGAPKARGFMWGDMLNPGGGLALPEDSPAAAAGLIDPALRGKLVVLVRLGRSDPAGRECIARSARFLLSRGYPTAGWCASSGRAAGLWAMEFARWRAAAAKAGARGKKDDKPGEPMGLVFAVRDARLLELERFAEAAWRGAEIRKKKGR